MPLLESLSLRFDGHSVLLLDQQALPAVERWFDATDPAEMVAAIRALKVRGAPAIGVAAALCLAACAARGAEPEALVGVSLALERARPTAVNLSWAMVRMRATLERGGAAALPAEARAIFEEDVALCEAMATRGAALLGQGERVLTHCNTGGLATAGVGTALGVVRRGWEQGRVAQVWVDETRPLLQGARLTAWELARLGIPHALLVDGAAASLLAAERVDRVLVGADRVAANGDFANKVGTLGLAVLAARYGVPFHVVAPWSTVDLACPDGAAIPIEDRDPAEVRGVDLPGVRQAWAPVGTPVYNPAFDVTPAALVTSLVLDRGVLTAEALAAGGLSRLRRST